MEQNKEEEEVLSAEYCASFYDKVAEKKERQAKTLDLSYGEITSQNMGQLRLLLEKTLPVKYQNNFYRRLVNFERYSKLCYFKDVLIAAITVKEEMRDGEMVLYMMTITVLKPYRRYQVGSMLMAEMLRDLKERGEFKKMYLDV